MKSYKQKVLFSRVFYIEAACAEDASSMLDDMADAVERQTDLHCEGYTPFEDIEDEPSKD